MTEVKLKYWKFFEFLVIVVVSNDKQQLMSNKL